jgi:hypothetical protein
LRTLVQTQPEEARVEGEGAEKPEAVQEIERSEAERPAPPTQGEALEAAALGKPKADVEAPSPPATGTPRAAE